MKTILRIKRITIIIILGICNCSLLAQNTTVSANILGLKGETVDIIYTNNKKQTKDEVKVENENFIWQTNLQEPTQVTMLTSDNYIFEFWAENGQMQIIGSMDSLDSAKIIGSKTQDEAAIFNSLIQNTRNREQEFYAKLESATEDEVKILNLKINELNQKREALIDQFIDDYPNSFVSISLINRRTMSTGYKTLKKWYKKLGDIAKNSLAGQSLVQRMEIGKRSDVGSPILNFSMNDEHGNLVNIADFKGKYVLIDFWASWCKGCRLESPNISKAYNNYKDKNFVVVAISLDEKKESWEKAIAEDNMPFIQLCDFKGAKGEVTDYYQNASIPFTLLINPEGKIVARDPRGPELHKVLAELLD